MDGETEDLPASDAMMRTLWYFVQMKSGNRLLAEKSRARRKVGRKAKTRPRTARRKTLILDQVKLDALRTFFEVPTDQEAVELAVDQAVADKEIIAATLELQGKAKKADDFFGVSESEPKR
jgi:hypothetical protein